ncbi:flagellar biosynthesis protein FliQ [Novosphingobium rosa]|jgi:flagellar biosynthetic protein FliQ|uniref:flagellar biosynthesis protein FliQ n=1 Tax=Novosphingobium rosa TaxID=76978 RepID=UPI00082FD739|nr:flagellar biosynthesis protein FliQ [Novosphingobium rosa]
MDDTSLMLSLADRMLWVVTLCAAPVLLGCLAVGLIVGIFQAATSINEQTLTFLPKIAITVLLLMLLGASMMGLIGDFTKDIFAAIARLGAGTGNVG